MTPERSLPRENTHGQMVHSAQQGETTPAGAAWPRAVAPHARPLSLAWPGISKRWDEGCLPPVNLAMYETDTLAKCKTKTLNEAEK